MSPTIYGCGCNVVSSERSVTSPLTDHRRAQFGARSRAGSLRPLLAGKIIRRRDIQFVTEMGSAGRSIGSTRCPAGTRAILPLVTTA